MSVKKSVFVIVSAVHLAVIVLSSARINSIPENSLGEFVIGPLLHCTGDDNAFGFFAPGVASELCARLTFEDRHGAERNFSFQDLFSVEGSLRATTSVAIFGRLTKPKNRSELAASWAAWGLGKFPEARRVRIDINLTELPKMAEYRDGKPIKHHEFYSAVFDRPKL